MVRSTVNVLHGKAEIPVWLEASVLLETYLLARSLNARKKLTVYAG
jgi:hypothetical protein